MSQVKNEHHEAPNGANVAVDALAERFARLPHALDDTTIELAYSFDLAFEPIEITHECALCGACETTTFVLSDLFQPSDTKAYMLDLLRAEGYVPVYDNGEQRNTILCGPCYKELKTNEET